MKKQKLSFLEAIKCFESFFDLDATAIAEIESRKENHT